MKACIYRVFTVSLLLTSGAFSQFPAEEKKDKGGRPGAPAEVKKPVRVEGDEFRYGDVFFNQKTREIRFAAAVIQDEAILEYAIVHAITGKVHESLLATEVSPLDLQIAMKLLRYKDSQRDIWPTYNEEGKIAKPMGDDGKGRVEFFITATDEKGKKSTFPLSDWVEKRPQGDPEQAKAMTPETFTYTGSDVYEGFYIAESEGAIAAIYRYAGAMFNSFQPLSDDDNVWFPVESKVPAIGTKVEVTIKPLADTKPSKGWKAPEPEKTEKEETKTESK